MNLPAMCGELGTPFERKILLRAFELAAAGAEIAKLQRVLGKKTLDNEILWETVDYAAEKKWIARLPLLPGEVL